MFPTFVKEGFLQKIAILKPMFFFFFQAALFLKTQVNRISDIDKSASYQ